jgi:hypothetical protein
VTIYETLLSRGYFPKELPPPFFTEIFSEFARTTAGRKALASYKPQDGFTECVSYRLALAGMDGLASRNLQIPHPHAFAKLAGVVSQHFRRLLKKSGASPFSKSRPVYGPGQERAIRTLFKPSNLAREKTVSRAGATHLLKVDISQFYPSLYTHAVGWAVDPKLRQRKYWKKTKLLGKRIDQLLMDLQGKVSQGIPIGNDISFLLAEVVLAQIDRSLKLRPKQGYRWYDDYEIPCSSRSEAEEILGRLTRLLETFKLRPNPSKTQILELPVPAGDGWHEELHSLSKYSFFTTNGMVSYFDHAFRLRKMYPDDPVLMYAIAVLFSVRNPDPAVQRVAESCISQAILSEPGCAQKAFALLTYWEVNGSNFDRTLVIATVDRLSMLHESRGLSSDIAWALAFAIQNQLRLGKTVGVTLSRLDDDAVALQHFTHMTSGCCHRLSAAK